jgi:tRNA (cmo5U34)-methyltransferase
VLSELHHAFKKANGYSELEIAQKRAALEKVLVTESLDVHRQRLHAAGFGQVQPWFQCLNFVSLLAIK